MSLALAPCTEYNIKVEVPGTPVHIWTQKEYKTPCGCTDPFRYSTRQIKIKFRFITVPLSDELLLLRKRKRCISNMKQNIN